MSATGLEKANAVVSSFHADHFTWVPAPTVREDPDWTTTRYHATATEIFIPHYTDSWNEGDEKIIVHEFGHVVAWNSEHPLEGFLFAMGADPALINNKLINEVFAEHFTHAYVDGYDGHNYPQLVGLVPFDAPKMRAFCERLTPAVPIVVVAPAPITPAAPPAVVISDDLASHYFSQWDGDHRGSGDCVPTCMKMLLSLYSLPTRTIGELRDQCDLSDNGRLDLGRDAGITLMAASLALIEDGLPATAMMARDVAFDDVIRIVREGTPCMVFVVYGHISNRVDQGFRDLHAIVLARADGATAAVLDPDRDFGGGHPDQRGPVFYAIDELRRGYDEGQADGGGAVIPDDALGGSDLMSPEKFREMFLDVYADIGVAKKFGELATQIGETIHMVERVQAGETIQDAELAAAKATLDKLRDL